MNRPNNETGVIKGSNRKFTNWAQYSEKNHSIMWLIDHAVSLQMLEEVLKFAAYQTNASSDTRRKWADAAQKKKFVLERRPPSFEKIEFKEAMELFLKAQKELGISDGIYNTDDPSGFKSLRSKELNLIGEGKPTKDPNPGKDFLAVTKTGPIQAQVSQSTQAAIDAAEVPRYVDPALILAREEKGRLAKYTDGTQYGEAVSQTVTEMRVLARRLKCPPWPQLSAKNHDLNQKDGYGVTFDPSECVYNEWDIKFFRGEEDVTEAVVRETHPDSMRQSRDTRGCAVFQSMEGCHMAPVVWKARIEERYSVSIRYDQSAVVFIRSVVTGRRNSKDVLIDLASLDAPPPPPSAS